MVGKRTEMLKEFAKDRGATAATTQDEYMVRGLEFCHLLKVTGFAIGQSQGHFGQIEVFPGMGHHFMPPAFEQVPVLKVPQDLLGYPLRFGLKRRQVPGRNHIETSLEAILLVDFGNAVKGLLETVVKAQTEDMALGRILPTTPGQTSACQRSTFSVPGAEPGKRSGDSKSRNPPPDRACLLLPLHN